jgi:hypothetical protein
MAYLVTVWRLDGKVVAETFPTLKGAEEGYNRVVEPNNPHSLNHFVILSKELKAYRHNPYTAGKRLKK